MVCRYLLGINQAVSVADIAAAIVLRVRVDAFTVQARPGSAQAVVGPNDRRKVTDTKHRAFSVIAATDESNDRIVGIVGRNPLESGGFKIKLIQRRCVAIEPVQVPDKAAYAIVLWVVEQVPVE